MIKQTIISKFNTLARIPWLKYPALLLVVVLPFILPSDYYIHVLNILGIFFILTISLDLVFGTTGLLQLGHAGFFGFGAYVGAIISTRLLPGNWIGFWVGLPVVAIFTMAVGLLVGIPTLRLKGIYFALATLGFGEIMRSILLNWQSITNGPYGIKAIPSPQLGPINLGDATSSYFLIWIFVSMMAWIIYILRKSKFGRNWRAIREDEIGASSLGINIYSMKIWALAISAGIAGIAGSIFAHYISYINPSNFTMDESILILSMSIVGGRDMLSGALVGTALLWVLPEALRSVAEYRSLIYGIIILFMVIYRPKGVMG